MFCYKNLMQLTTNPTDHYKEYFYKISANGSKNYYHREANGHKRIAKAKIPFSFLDRIKPYNDKTDPDWLRQKQTSIKRLEKSKLDKERYLKLYFDGKLSEKNFSRSVDVLDNRIESCQRHIKYCNEMNNQWSEQRYKEETGQYGGFKNYFKAKYSQYDHRSKSQESGKGNGKGKGKGKGKYKTLKEESIILSDNDSYNDVRKRYRRWLVKNHPDKGGSDERCRDVIGEFKEFEQHRG